MQHRSEPSILETAVFVRKELPRIQPPASGKYCNILGIVFIKAKQLRTKLQVRSRQSIIRK